MHIYVIHAGKTFIHIKLAFKTSACLGLHWHQVSFIPKEADSRFPWSGLGQLSVPAVLGICCVSCFPQQWRLLPYLAAAYALDHFSKTLFLDLMEVQRARLRGDHSDRQVRHLFCDCQG